MNALKQQLITTFGVWLLLCGTQIASAYYDPSASRWINRDPARESGFRHASGTKRGNQFNERNLYQFVVNDPVGRWDYLGLDSPGCDTGLGVLPGETLCNLRCCAQHDICFAARGCKAGRALLGMLWCSRCGRCNWEAVGCMAGCALGGEGPTDVEPYFCPNGPHTGESFSEWDEIPALEGTSISDAGLEVIASQMRLTGVNVANCSRVTGKGLQALARSETLSDISFSATNLEQNQILQIIESFKPNVTRCAIIDTERKLRTEPIKAAAAARRIQCFVYSKGALQMWQGGVHRREKL